MRTAILGCGYLGKALAFSLTQNAHQVSLSTRQPEKLESLKDYAAKVVLVNHSLEPLLQGQENLIVAVAPAAGESYQATYLDTALRLASLLPKFPSIKHIIYIGSTSVYGEHAGQWVDETTPPLPLNAQTQILLETEKVFLSLSNASRKACVLRLSEIIGPGRELKNRFNSAERKIFPGTGDNYTNLIHLDDILSVIDFALKESFEGIYNVCCELHIPRKELYELLCRRNNLPIPLWDKQKANFHGGNKRVFCGKLNLSGYSTPFRSPY
jgi:nucleoside-diphosphate-sugar epimerase